MTLTIPVSSNDMHMLEHDFLKNNPIGVGQLSRFLGVEISELWHWMPVRIQNIYDPEIYWQFCFRSRQLTGSRLPKTTIVWDNKPLGKRLPPS